MIGQVASGLITLMLAKFCLNDVPHALFSNPGNPSSSVTSDIIARTGMKEYEYRFFPGPVEPSKPRAYPYTRAKQIGPYEVRLTRTDGACTVKLYEFLEGWKKKLRATWSGLDKVECDRKFEEVCDVTRQVRAEHIIEMRRALGG